MTTPKNTPNPATTTRPSKSSARVAHKRPLAWLPLALLALLALVIALIVLFIVLANRHDDNDSAAATSTPSASAAAAGAQQNSSAGAAAAPAAASSPLTVAGTDLLSLSAGSLADRAGQPVTGTALVQSVVSDEGFWVGGNTANRVFVHLTPAARQSNGESKFQVAAGQKVQLTGQMTALASAPTAAAGVTDAEGRGQLANQGALVQADNLTLLP
jgi:hypothetical protein